MSKKDITQMRKLSFLGFTRVSKAAECLISLLMKCLREINFFSTWLDDFSSNQKVLASRESWLRWKKVQGIFLPIKQTTVPWIKLGEIELKA